MPYVIHLLDKPGCEDLRAALRAEHLAYLTQRQARILAAGALLDDGGKAIGGLLIVDTEDRAAAEQFATADPFHTGGLTGSVHLMRWRKSFFDGQRIP